MNAPAIGSLFTGTGALDMAAQAIFGGRTVWYSDIKPAAVELLAHRLPGIPNLGNLVSAFPVIGPITRQAAELEPIDILTGGWPCQPHSSAGKRLGEADPRALWPNVARALAELRPAVFLGENVARVATNGELRRVVRSLDALGYVGTWRCRAAAEDGAPHKRARCFVLAVRADVAADPERLGLAGWPDRLGARRPPSVGGEAGDYAGYGSGAHALTLLKTPTANLGSNGGSQHPDKRKAGGHGPTLADEVEWLLPTPSASSYGTNQGGAAGRVGPVRESLDTMARRGRFDRWGRYAAAIERWEHVLGRPAPDATVPSPKAGGSPILSPAFVEWMMGLPQGWVSEVEGLAPKPAGLRNARLSLLGDGVVRQQAEAAYRECLVELFGAGSVAA